MSLSTKIMLTIFGLVSLITIVIGVVNVAEGGSASSNSIFVEKPF